MNAESDSAFEIALASPFDPPPTPLLALCCFTDSLTGLLRVPKRSLVPDCSELALPNRSFAGGDALTVLPNTSAVEDGLFSPPKILLGVEDFCSPKRLGVGDGPEVEAALLGGPPNKLLLVAAGLCSLLPNRLFVGGGAMVVLPNVLLVGAAEPRVFRLCAG